ncbi:MAG: N-methyl-L-tryptophan oxidase [Candidatus Eremiobacteraeota bacterium]|nr:N-methyl-L-tryptophan oxidase [Candidatus Eremiobacteraeota bacterium]
MRYDVAVIGLGGMGAATLSHLARRGVHCIGIERFERLHENGASHGESRIIRKAYFENPAYVPLLERSYELWRELQATTDRKLVDFVGILMVGEPGCEGIAGTLRTAKQWNLPLDEFDADQIARRFPGTMPRPAEVGLLERQAGIVFPEPALDAHLNVATQHGAEMHFSNGVERWEKHDGTHRLTLADDTVVVADKVAVCPGMWASKLLAELELPLRVQRNVQVWFEPHTNHFDRGVFPTFFIERLDLPGPLYGFPAMNGTMKAAFHRFGETVDPDRIDRRIRDDDVTIVGNALDEWLEHAAGSYVRGRVCTYTLTPDGNFIVDKHPNDPSVTIACGFSGHGYKFSPVIGEICADLVLDGGTRHDIGFLGMNRFSQSSIRPI